MAKKLGKLLAFAAAASAVAAGTYYYLQNKNKGTSEKHEEEDFDEYDDFDDFENSAIDEDDFEDESEIPEKEESPEDKKPKEDPIISKQCGENGHTYVTLDLKAAQDKASALYNSVAGKVNDTVTKIKSTYEYEAVSGKINDTVNKIKNSEEFQAADDHLEAALSKVKEATEKAVDIVGEKLNSTIERHINNAEDIIVDDLMDPAAPDNSGEVSAAPEEDAVEPKDTVSETMEETAEPADVVSEVKEETPAVKTSENEEASVLEETKE